MNNYNIRFILFFLLFNIFSFLYGTETINKENYLKVTENGKNLEYGSIVYISEYPEFPTLIAEVPANCKSVKWTLKAMFNRPNRNKQAKPFLKKYTGDKIWNFTEAIDSKFIGGILILTAKTDEGKFYLFSLNIRAKNPSESVILNYIGNHPKFAQAIARHESGLQNGRYYCQFNEVGKLGDNYLLNIKHTPNRGSDMLGWGIFQVTSPSPSKTDLWNWKANVDTGKKILNEKEAEAKEYFKAVKRTYPEKYEPPPVSYKVPGTNTTLTSLESATIQLYNGGAVVKSLLNSYGTYSTYASCWKFIPKNLPERRWKFVPNRNNYVKKVILAYEAMKETEIR